MTVLVINHGIIKSISILTAIIHPIIKFDVDKQQNCFHQEVKWTLAIHSQLRLSLGWISTTYTTFHTLCFRKMLLIVRYVGINEFQTLCVRFNVVEIIKLRYGVPCWVNNMGFNLIDLCSNLVPVWACNIQCGPLLQHITFKISCVGASNAMD